jgi:protein gp37
MGARGVIRAPEGMASGAGAQGGMAEHGRAAPPEWYDVTWNPTSGCSAAGPGCDHCLALRMVSQLARMGGKGGARYAGLTTMERSGSQWTGEIRVRTDLLTWPLFQRRPRRILVASMSDLFHEKMPTETIDALHAVMTVAHWHRFLVLTKRAERMRAYYGDRRTPHRIAVEVDILAGSVLPSLGSGPDSGAEAVVAAPIARRETAGGVRQQWAPGLSRVVRQTAGAAGAEPEPVGLDPWPLPNLWPGVSVEDQARMTRIGDLLQMPAVLRWACFEPLLGPVRPDAVPVGEDYVDAFCGGRYALDGDGRMVPSAGPAWRPLDWVVAGGEVGAGARPADPDWVRGLRDKCVAAGVPFFFKQWGEWAPASDARSEPRMVRLGRRAAGRLVDGRCWDEAPAAMRKGRGRAR